MLILALGCFALFALSYLGLRLYEYLAASQPKLIDRPNHRSSHSQPTLRGSGLVICLMTLGLNCLLLLLGFSNLLLLLGFSNNMKLIAITSISAILGVLVWFEDYYGLPIFWRLVLQIITALSLSLVIFGWPFDWTALTKLNWPLIEIFLNIAMLAGLLFCIVAHINFFNFMDGSNGLNLMLALSNLGMQLGFIYGTQLKFGAELGLDLIPGLIIGSQIIMMLALLSRNFPKAKVFIGDSGSYYLGALTIGLGLYNFQYNNLPLLIILLANMTVWSDAGLTLLLRLCQGKNILEAHREHSFQILMHQYKWSHTKIWWLHLGLNCVYGSLAWLYVDNCLSAGLSLSLAMGLSLLLHLFVKSGSFRHDKLCNPDVFRKN